MKRFTIGLIVAAGFAWALAGAAAAQDRPGLAMGVFYEMRIDNNVAAENLSFDYYGVRLKLRDERWFEGFVDLGIQSAEWGDYSADGSGYFGIGGTLWLARAEDLVIPLDLGLSGSYHQGRSKLDNGAGPASNGTYSEITGQAVIRAMGYGIVKPFLRAGVMKSKLDSSGLDAAGDWDVVNPAVNVGVEIEPTDQIMLTLEGNYSEDVGFAVHCDFWF